MVERKHALARLRERSAYVQAYLHESERRTREADAALLVGLRRYAERASAAHTACARVQALDALWAQGAHERAQLEKRLSEAITDLLSRSPPGVPLGTLGGAWSEIAGAVVEHIARARSALTPGGVEQPDRDHGAPLSLDRLPHLASVGEKLGASLIHKN
ncbi:hypothetical protein T492DRAFT_1018863 [Pavlovales sp. CCMP2436]|nr:hypothetical protein T492DRAFT_1018863 [Pavlovales sp. CCMP2436]